MTVEQPKRDVSEPVREPPQRRPWTAPTLTVRSIEDLTLGRRASTRTDGNLCFS